MNENENKKAPQDDAKSKKRKNKFSGAYYYIDADGAEIAKYSLARNILSAGAFLLQAVVLIFFKPKGLAFVTEKYPSVAYTYMWTVFLMLFVSLYVCIMNFTRYKLNKRIPVERAPKKGFGKRVFLGAELFIPANLAVFAFELAFTCISFDGWGLGATLVCAVAVAAAVCARQVSHAILKRAVLIPAAEENEPSKT